jgi:ribonuclease HI
VPQKIHRDIVRDESDPFLIGGLDADPAVMEAMACMEALALAQDLQLQMVTVATNCLAMVSDIKRPSVGSYRSMILE